MLSVELVNIITYEHQTKANR